MSAMIVIALQKDFETVLHQGHLAWLGFAPTEAFLTISVDFFMKIVSSLQTVGNLRRIQRALAKWWLLS